MRLPALSFLSATLVFATLIPAQAAKPTLYLIGDSTVRNGSGDGRNGQWGWGDKLAPYFDAAKITVVNKALGGRSSRTFISEGHWDTVLERLQAGDIVMMQFGHNDSGPLEDTSRARGTIKGIGEESREIDNPITKRHETVHTYGWYLRKYIADIRARSAIPIICSPIPRNIWKDGHVGRNKNDYAGWAAEIAAAEKVAFVDLNDIIADKYDSLGEEQVAPLFFGDHTHTSLPGSELNAACVVLGLRRLKESPLAAYVAEKAKEPNACEVKPAAP